MAATMGPQLDLEIPAATMAYEVRYVAHESVHPDPTQPRKEADAELVASIRTNGMLQPISVRRHPERLTDYLIIDGERRWRGAAGVLVEVPVIVRDDLDERVDRLRTQLVANVGKPLTPMEEAEAFAELLPGYESVAALARALGRSERTVGDRLHLLDLGPWTALVASGRLPLTHAVKVLIPLRGCPTEVHELAIPRVEKQLPHTSWEAVTVREFERAVRLAYEPSMYPLTKSKDSWGKQPQFDTKAHDRECSCGRMQWQFTHNAKRAACGNPAWWRPLHKKALQAAPKKKASGTQSQSRPQSQAPEGARVATEGKEPKGAVKLTGYHGWESHGFDAPALSATLEPKDLVLVRPRYGDPYMATTNTAAVKAARETWHGKWSDRREALLGPVRKAYQAKGKAYAVRGPGVAELLVICRPLEKWNNIDLCAVLDAAAVAGVSLPAAVVWSGLADRNSATPDALTKALGNLSEAHASAVATALAYLLGTRTVPPTRKVLDELAAEQKRMEKKAIPWVAKAKDAPKAKGKGRVAAIEAPDDEEEWEDDDDA